MSLAFLKFCPLHIAALMDAIVGKSPLCLNKPKHFPFGHKFYKIIRCKPFSIHLFLNNEIQFSCHLIFI